MSIGAKTQLGLLAAGEVALLALVAVFGYAPGVRGIHELECTLAGFSQDQSALCQLVESNPNPVADIELARNELRQLETRIPPESKINWLSGRLTELMGAHQIDLRAATEWSESKDKAPAPELKRLEKQMTVTSTTQNLEAFLEAVNRLPFVVIVNDLQVSRDPSCGGVSASVRLSTFVLRAQSAAPASTARNGDQAT